MAARRVADVGRPGQPVLLDRPQERHRWFLGLADPALPRSCPSTTWPRTPASSISKRRSISTCPVEGAEGKAARLAGCCVAVLLPSRAASSLVVFVVFVVSTVTATSSGHSATDDRQPTRARLKEPVVRSDYSDAAVLGHAPEHAPYSADRGPHRATFNLFNDTHLIRMDAQLATETEPPRACRVARYSFVVSERGGDTVDRCGKA